VKCFFNGNNPGEEDKKKIVRNTRMKFKDLLLKIIADLHFFAPTQKFCVWSFASTRKLHAQYRSPLNHTEGNFFEIMILLSDASLTADNFSNRLILTWSIASRQMPPRLDRSLR
jgi:hypothetical protein